ncbi:MAG: lysophospholipid acyltransferase family protein [Planctomycetes bacterium]|nr:lysophospholipid acyltransferase family protein [Planctomycetota bacterium]
MEPKTVTGRAAEVEVGGPGLTSGSAAPPVEGQKPDSASDEPCARPLRSPPSLKRRIRRALRRGGVWVAVEYAQFLAFRLAETAFAALPVAGAAALGRFLARVAFRVLPGARAEAKKNLHLAYGASLSEAACEDLARRSFEHFGASLPDALVFPRRARPATLARLAGVENLEPTRAALRAGRGVLWVIAHLGSWELGGLYAGAAGLPCSAVARPMPNPFIDAEVRRLRTATGLRILDRKGALRDALRALRSGEVVSLVLDVEPDEGGVSVPFFGRPTRFFGTAGVLALRTGCLVVPCWTRRDGPLSYRMGCASALETRPQAPADEEIARITAEVARHFEAFIRQAPEQYAWSLRRWRETEPRP